MAIYLGCRLPCISSDLPVAVEGQPSISELRLLLGLAPDEACPATPVAGCPVGSYPTISPLPWKIPKAVCFLLRCLWRHRRQCRPRLLTGVLSEGARTFLSLHGPFPGIMEAATIYFLPDKQNQSSYSSSSLTSSRSSSSSMSSSKSSSKSTRLPAESSKLKKSSSPSSCSL